MSRSHHKGKFGVGGLSPNATRDETRAISRATFDYLKRAARVERARERQTAKRASVQATNTIEVD